MVAHLLENAKILVNDGIIYGPQSGGENYIRVVFGCFASDEKAKSAYQKIAEGLKQLSK